MPSAFQGRQRHSGSYADGDARPSDSRRGEFKFQRFTEYAATVRIRRDAGRNIIPPELDQIEGQRLLFLAECEITPDEYPAYAGETTMVVWDEGQSPVAWLPSGDLADIRPVEQPRATAKMDLGMRVLLEKEAQHAADEIARQQRFIRQVRGEE